MPQLKLAKLRKLLGSNWTWICSLCLFGLYSGILGRSVKLYSDCDILPEDITDFTFKRAIFMNFDTLNGILSQDPYARQLIHKEILADFKFNLLVPSNYYIRRTLEKLSSGDCFSYFKDYPFCYNTGDIGTCHCDLLKRATSLDEDIIPIWVALTQ